MLLVYTDKVLSEQRSQEAWKDVIAGHVSVKKEAARRGCFAGAVPLNRRRTPKPIGFKANKFLIVEGLFAETREQLAGTISSIARTWMRRLSGARNLFQSADPLVIAASKSVHWRITRRLIPVASKETPD